MNLRDLFLRARTAVVFVLLMITGLGWNQYSYAVLMLLILNLSLNEYFNLLKPHRHANRVSQWYKPMALVIGTAVFALTYAMANGWLGPGWLAAGLASIFRFFGIEIFSTADEPFTNIGFNVAGMLYVVAPIAMLNFAAFHWQEYAATLVLGIIFIIWIYDSGCYLAGSHFGKTPLYKRLSPKKTVEGLIGGTLFCLLLAFILSLVFTGYSLGQWVVMAIILVIFSTIGDLVESMFKRSLHIKDSGNFFPGHGGLLDRFDTFFFAIPFVSVYVVLMS